MTVIRPNSVSGITSITAQANEINFFRSNGTLAGLQLNGINFNTTTGISTLAALNVTGNVSVGGTLTYQDVTNVDSVGIITAQAGINVSGGQLDVGSNIKIGNAGVITATTFVGNLTGSASALASSVFASGPSDNRIVTTTGGNNLNPEISLQFDGTSTLELQPTSATPAIFVGDSNRTGAGQHLAEYRGNWNGTLVGRIVFAAGDDTTNKDDGIITMHTTPSGGSSTERLRITSVGEVKIPTGSNSTNRLTFGGGINIYHDGNMKFENATGYLKLQSNNALYIDGSTHHFRTSSGTERLRIDSSGKVSIASGAYGGGGTTPELYVKGTSGRQMKIHNSNAGTSSLQITNGTTGEGEDAGTQLFTQGSTGDFYISNQYASGDISFNTRPSGGSNTNRLTIASDGVITHIGRAGAAANPAIDPLTSFVLNDAEARLQLCATNGGNNAAALILSNESKHFIIHQRGPNQSNNFEIGYLDNASPSDINNQATTYLRVTTDGYVTKPAHPSFCARHNTGNGFVNTDIICLTRMSGWHSWNSGHYSTSTGKFTAPVDGVYYFEAQAMTTGHNNGDNIQDMMSLESNRGRISYCRQRQTYFRTDENANGYFTNSVGGSIKLNATDTVWFQRKSGHTWGFSNQYYTYFTGWLIG